MAHRSDPIDWDCELYRCRLCLIEPISYADAMKLLSEGTVRVEEYEGGAWREVARWWPAWQLPCGSGIPMTPDYRTQPDAMPSRELLAGRFLPARRVRAARTRVWFPERAWFVVDVTFRCRGPQPTRALEETLFPLYTRVPGSILSTCLVVPSEVPENAC